MPHAIDTPPADTEVCDFLTEHGVMRAGELVAAMSANKIYSRRDVQGAIQRCLDRGFLELDDDLALKVSDTVREFA